MNEEKNLEIVKQGYEHFANGDIAGLLALFDPDIEWVTPTVEGADHTGPRRGRDSLPEFFGQLEATEDISRFEPREFIAQDDKVVVLGNIKATVKTTGREYETDWVHIFRLADGKITGFTEFFDNAVVTKAFQKELTAGKTP
jgi:hypothetical protein